MTSYLALRSKRLAEKEDLLNQVLAQLRIYAKQKRGKFLLFGSVARNSCPRGSDLDLIADFGAYEKNI